MALPLQEARPCQARRGGPHAGHPPPEASSGLGTLRRLPPSREVGQAPALPSACGQQAAGWGGPSRAWGGQKLPCSCTAPRRSPRAPLPSAPRRKMSGGHRVGLALLESVWMLGPPPGAWRWPSRTPAACPQQPRPDSGQPRGFSSWGRVPPTPGTMAFRGLGPDWKLENHGWGRWVGSRRLALCPAPTCSCLRSQLGVSPVPSP